MQNTDNKYGNYTLHSFKEHKSLIISVPIYFRRRTVNVSWLLLLFPPLKDGRNVPFCVPECSCVQKIYILFFRFFQKHITFSHGT